MLRRTFTLPAVTAAALASIVLADVRLASANDTVAAQALYDDGKRLMGEKKFAEACPKFAESQRLDPGVGTHYALADCYEAAGKIASAWAAFIDVESESKAQNRADRATIARKRADVLAPRLSRIAIAVPDASRVAGLVVRRDREELGEGQWGTAVPVDPGRHEIVAAAPGKKEWRTSVDVTVEGKVFPVSVPPLEDGPPTATSASTATSTTVPPPPPPSSGLGTQKILAIGSLVVGVAGLGVGGFFGIQAMSKHSDSQNHCQGNACDPVGLQDVNDGKSAGNLATIFLPIGVVGVAAAVVLWVTAPKTASPPRTGLRLVPMLGARGGGATLQGAW